MKIPSTYCLTCNFWILARPFWCCANRQGEARIRLYAEGNGYHHAIELQEQTNHQFNKGIFVDGSEMKVTNTPFSYGVACYPELMKKLPISIRTFTGWRRKWRPGECRYPIVLWQPEIFRFRRTRPQKPGYHPIIPGIKPFKKLSQLSMIPKTFKVDLPERTDKGSLEMQKWRRSATSGYRMVHTAMQGIDGTSYSQYPFYSIGAVDSIREVAKQIY